MAGGMGCSFHNENDSNCFLCSNLSREPPPSPLFLDISGYLPTSDMCTVDTHQEGQNSNPSNKQRRKRELFTDNEVEALVRGVQKHGVGSWTNIQVEFFENNSRRTPKDLKDKWKNLGRTATLSADQRRGENVPPESLLEIVRRVNGF